MGRPLCLEPVHHHPSVRVILRVQNCQVLIISKQQLFIEALVQVLRTVGIRAIDRAINVQTARPLLKNRAINVILVDHSVPQQTEWEVLAWLDEYVGVCQIVFLTPLENQMVVYRREQLPYGAPEQLIDALSLPLQ